MYMIDGDKPFCFIAHPKTGSRSVQTALEGIGAYNVQGHHFIDEDVCESVRDCGGTVCSVVRNPFDVMVSWYAMFLNSKQYNPDWPNTPSFSSWCPRFLAAGNGWIERGLFYGDQECTKIIRWELGVEAQLNALLLDCGLETMIGHLGQEGASKRLDHRFYYNDNTEDLVARYCYKELARYGYTL